MKNLSTSNDLMQLDSKKRYIVGHFSDLSGENYHTFTKVASHLRDDCNFAASTGGEDFKHERQSGDVVYYRPVKSTNENDNYYQGSISSQEALYAWASEKCVPIVREITFENAEELTDEGLPFLILFHDVNDHHSIARFEKEVSKQLMHERSAINCLHADGAKFMHPLHHLGKTAADLPLLAIDSFRHMFLFPDIHELSVGDKLLQFVKDLHSGKLHQDFHNPQPVTTAKSVVGDPKSKGDTPHIPKTSASNQNEDHDSTSDPPDSVFIHLAPSRQRYSFRDEL